LGDVFEQIQFVQTTGGYADYADHIRTFAPTHVVHLAWDGGNSYADVNQSRQVSVNLPSGIELLEILASLPTPPHFIGFGSFAEYGLLSTRAVETQPDAPVTFYGLAKSMFRRVAEKLCSDHGMRMTWVRPCYIYGPGDVATRLIPSVMRRLLTQTPIQLDSCNVTIDYLHVSDYCSAMMRLLETGQCGIVNVCSGIEYSLRDILDRLVSTARTSASIEFDPSRDRVGLSTYIVGEPGVLTRLGWAPAVSMDEGLHSVFDEIRNELFLATNPVEHDGIHPIDL
jgi:GDP-4-dehydro-6-deoxy-D-mannose reductase